MAGKDGLKGLGKPRAGLSGLEVGQERRSLATVVCVGDTQFPKANEASAASRHGPYQPKRLFPSSPGEGV